MKTAVLVLALSVAGAAHAGGVAKEMSVDNGIDELVLTVQECPIAENFGYIHYAYVLEKAGIVAEGCWLDYGRYVDIWIPAMKAHFQLEKSEFTPRD